VGISQPKPVRTLIHIPDKLFLFIQPWKCKGNAQLLLLFQANGIMYTNVIPENESLIFPKITPAPLFLPSRVPNSYTPIDCVEIVFKLLPPIPYPYGAGQPRLLDFPRNRVTYMGSSGPSPISCLNTPSPTGVKLLVWPFNSQPLEPPNSLPGVSGMLN